MIEPLTLYVLKCDFPDCHHSGRTHGGDDGYCSETDAVEDSLDRGWSWPGGRRTFCPCHPYAGNEFYP